MMVSNEDIKQYDIVIAGGGMIGSSLALALAPLKLRVAIVEPVTRSAAAQPSFDDRATAMSRSTQRTYEAMGLWDSIVAASTPIQRIHVSDKGRFGFSHLDAREQGVEALGYVVMNRVLGGVLQNALDAIDDLDNFYPARIVATRLGPEYATATVESERGDTSELQSKLVVAADGSNSTVRDLLGIAARQVSYEQSAVVGNLMPEKSLESCAYERFTEQGPLALLPMSEGRAGFVWTLRTADAERALELPEQLFLEELQQAFGYRLGSFSRIGRRVAYPLTLSKAVRLTAPRAVLVGNAAHGLHPVAAQGFNLGLRDVAALCDCIADAIDASCETGTRADVGAADLLEHYADWRRRDQAKLVGFTDGLVRLFGHSSRPVRIFRNIGMLGFDLIPGVRKVFARHTMGLAGRLPRLSRGVPLS